MAHSVKEVIDKQLGCERTEIEDEDLTQENEKLKQIQTESLQAFEESMRRRELKKIKKGKNFSKQKTIKRKKSQKEVRITFMSREIELLRQQLDDSREEASLKRREIERLFEERVNFEQEVEDAKKAALNAVEMRDSVVRELSVIKGELRDAKLTAQQMRVEIKTLKQTITQLHLKYTGVPQETRPQREARSGKQQNFQYQYQSNSGTQAHTFRNGSVQHTISSSQSFPVNLQQAAHSHIENRGHSSTAQKTNINAPKRRSLGVFGPSATREVIMSRLGQKNFRQTSMLLSPSSVPQALPSNNLQTKRSLSEGEQVDAENFPPSGAVADSSTLSLPADLDSGTKHGYVNIPILNPQQLPSLKEDCDGNQSKVNVRSPALVNDSNSNSKQERSDHSSSFNSDENTDMHGYVNIPILETQHFPSLKESNDNLSKQHSPASDSRPKRKGTKQPASTFNSEENISRNSGSSTHISASSGDVYMNQPAAVANRSYINLKITPGIVPKISKSSTVSQSSHTGHPLKS